MTYICVLVNSRGLEDGVSPWYSLGYVDRVRGVDELRWEVVPDDIDEDISSIGWVSPWSSKVISIDTELKRSLELLARMWKECKGNCTMSLLKTSYFKDNPYTEWIEVLSSQGDVVNWSTKHDISSDRVNQEISGGSGSRIQVISHHIMRRLVGKEIHL